MLKSAIALACLGAIGLAGCAPGTNTITSAQVSADLATFEQAVQAASVVACGVEPTAASVAALLTQGNAVATGVEVTASAVAGIICKALVAQVPAAAAHRYRLARVPAPVTVAGVVVSFEPVKAKFAHRFHGHK